MQKHLALVFLSVCFPVLGCINVCVNISLSAGFIWLRK